MLKNYRKDQKDHSCEKQESITQSQGGQEYPKHKKNEKKRANLISYILCRNCLLNFVMKVKTKEIIVVTERRGRRRKQLKSETGSTRLQSVENSL